MERPDNFMNPSLPHFFAKVCCFFFLQTNGLNFTFYYLLSDVCYLPSSEYSQLRDEQYIVQKPMWNVVRTINKTKLCSKCQRKVEYKIYREDYYLALRNLYFIELKLTILNIFFVFLCLCVYAMSAYLISTTHL